MKRSILTAGAALLLCGKLAAQTPPQYEFGGLAMSADALSTADLFSLSQQSFNFGTARSMAMGGAFTSLGADQASMVINPAGLGMYNRGEIAVTPMMTFSRAETPAGLTPSGAMPFRSNGKNRFALGNIGGGFNVYEGTGRLLSVNFGVGYNRLADYNYSYSFEFAGSNRTSSIADAFAVQLEAGGAYVDDNGTIAMKRDGWTATDWRIDPFFWPAVGAYKTYLVDYDRTDKLWYPGEIGDNATVNGGASVRSIGSAGEFDISMGANLNNKLYFGFTLGIQSIYQKKSIYYGEGYNYGGGNGYNLDQGGEYAVDRNGNPLANVMQSMGMTQTATVEGAGVNFKLGVVYSPVPNLRLGMAFHTPTFYSLDRRYGMSMSTASIGATSETDPRPHDYTSDTASDILEDSGDSGWEFVSPSRLMFGASYTFGDVAIVSVDYERDWYNGIRVKNMPYLAYGPAASDFKQDMKYYFKGANTVRAGVEVRPLPMLSVRAGFGYNGSMLRDERTILSSPAVAETTYYTAGLGFSLSRSVYLDVAYCYVKDTTTPYMLFYGNRYADDEAKTEIYQSEVYTTDFTRHNVALTLGFRF